MTKRKLLSGVLTAILMLFFSCSTLSGIKGVFGKPIAGKILSIKAILAYEGSVLNTSILLDITNPSSQKALITPIKVKVINKDGTESEQVYELKRKSPQEIEIKGGDILGGTLNVLNPNQSEQVQSGNPASLSKGESIKFNIGGLKSVPPKVQVSIGEEIFLITE